MKFFSTRNDQEEISNLKNAVIELQSRLDSLEDKLRRTKNLEKFHLMRIKNNEELSDDFILKNLTYLDLSPEKAFKLYSETDRDFILLDVSKAIYQPFEELPEVKKIPLEDLEYSGHLIHGKSIPIFVISEDGLRSILACKKLSELGFYNLNNISGGYKFWPGFRKADLTSLLKVV